MIVTNMDVDKILLNPGEVENLLDCIDIIPSHHYICICRNLDTKRIYIYDAGEDGWNNGEELEITEESN